MDPEFSKVSNGSATLHVSTWGTTGPTLLALHPGVGDSRIWHLCTPRWAAAGYRVVAYDRRGFGLTDSSPEPHDDVDDLLAVMNATETDSAVLIGNSRGGGIATDLALTSPERVSALVLIAPSLSGYDRSDWPTATAEDEQDVQLIAADEAGDLELLNRLETRYWLDGVEQREGRVSGEPRQLFLDMNGRALHAAPIGESSQRTPAWPMLSQINVPVLVMVGECDLPGIRKQCSETAAVLPVSELVDIPESAHCPSLDQPDLFSETVLAFLGRLPN